MKTPNTPDLPGRMPVTSDMEWGDGFIEPEEIDELTGEADYQRRRRAGLDDARVTAPPVFE